MPGLRRLPGPPPRSEFLVIDQEIHEASTGGDPDAVAVVHEGQGAADERFRRDIADAHPPRGSGKAAVGDEGNLFTHPLPVDKGGDTQHLSHPRPSDRAFIADDQNLTCQVSTVANSVDARLLVFENPRGSFEHETLETG